MNEFELIHRLKSLLPTHESVVVGVGDDCAVLDLGDPARLVLFKTDAVVQGVHFTSDARPEQVGHKALARCLSDIAAMAGHPTAALITLGLPDGFAADYIEGVYNGLGALARRHGCAIVGGETVPNPERLFISVALTGWVDRGKQILRSGARAGDALFVTGELGGSLKGHHLEFSPRLEEAQWLVKHFPPHAMIDLSDGLAGDLRHILQASGVGAELLAAAIPISRTARLESKRPGAQKHALMAALTDGEDFELLFTVAARDAVLLLDRWKAKFPQIRLTCIGKITAAAGLTIRDRHGIKPLTAHGHIHFQQP